MVEKKGNLEGGRPASKKAQKDFKRRRRRTTEKVGVPGGKSEGRRKNLEEKNKREKGQMKPHQGKRGRVRVWGVKRPYCSTKRGGTPSYWHHYGTKIPWPKREKFGKNKEEETGGRGEFGEKTKKKEGGDGRKCLCPIETPAQRLGRKEQKRTLPMRLDG